MNQFDMGELYTNILLMKPENNNAVNSENSNVENFFIVDIHFATSRRA